MKVVLSVLNTLCYQFETKADLSESEQVLNKPVIGHPTRELNRFRKIYVIYDINDFNRFFDLLDRVLDDFSFTVSPNSKNHN